MTNEWVFVILDLVQNPYYAETKKWILDQVQYDHSEWVFVILDLVQNLYGVETKKWILDQVQYDQ